MSLSIHYVCSPQHTDWHSIYSLGPMGNYDRGVPANVYSVRFHSFAYSIAELSSRSKSEGFTILFAYFSWEI